MRCGFNARGSVRHESFGLLDDSLRQSSHIACCLAISGTGWSSRTQQDSRSRVRFLGCTGALGRRCGFCLVCRRGAVCISTTYARICQRCGRQTARTRKKAGDGGQKTRQRELQHFPRSSGDTPPSVKL